MAVTQAINGQPAVYNSSAPTLSDGQGGALQLDVNGNLKTTATINAQDIQIGNVEIKDDTGTQTSSVLAPNAAAAPYSLIVQPARYLLTPIALTDTYTSPLLLGSKGQLLTNIYDGTNSASVTATGLKVDVGGAGTLTATASALDVNLKTSSITLPVSGTVTANQGSANATPWNENIAQINGVTPLMGNGTTGTGSLRVTIASDNTAFSVNATLAAETTKVIGTINIAAAQTLATLTTLTGGGVASGAADSGNPVKVGGKYNLAAITLTDGQRGDLQLDAAGRVITTLGTLISGEDQTNNVIKVEQQMSYSYISTATTTTVKSGAGFLHLVTVNGGTAGTIIIYDNTAASGTVIASFDSTNALATYGFNIKFTTGLTIVTAAATKMTVAYR